VDAAALEDTSMDHLTLLSRRLLPFQIRESP
jgi:hypothetical protein